MSRKNRKKIEEERANRKAAKATKILLALLGIGVVVGTTAGIGIDRFVKKVFVNEDWPEEEWSDDDWAEEDLEG